MKTTDELIAARVTVKSKIKVLEKKGALRSVSEDKLLKEWRALKRRLDREIKERIIQLPLL